MLGAAALDGFGDVLLGAVGGDFAGLGIEALQKIRRIVTGVLLDLADEQLFGFLRGQAGEPFELMFLGDDELLVLGCCRRRRLLAIDERALPADEIALEPLNR